MPVSRGSNTPARPLPPGIPPALFNAIAQQMGLLPPDGPAPAPRSAVARLPRRVWSAARGDEGVAEAHRCVVCLEDFAEGVEVITLPCFHFFHTLCAKR
jgi:hypothetical protein